MQGSQGSQGGHVVSPGAGSRQLPLTEGERDAARAHVERIVCSPLFAHSKRYPAFLRYVVERVLDGRADELKERTIGVEVFGRPSTYDTSQDPVVRTTAGEVRKRIAQYYQQAGHEDALRIELPVGSYVPELRPWPAIQAAASSPPMPPTPDAVPVRITPVSTLRWRGLGAAAAYTCAAVVLATVVTTAMWLRPWAQPNQLDRFWGPILETPGIVLLCVGPATADVGAGQAPSRTEPDEVTLHAATAISRMVGFLQAHGREFRVRPAASVTFSELRDHTAALVGGFNNEWTMKVTASLRYGFDRTEAGTRIVDRADTANPGWTRRYSDTAGVRQVLEDFAVVARVRDSASDQHVLIVAGIGRHGTAAAGEFLTEARYMEAVAKTAPPNWDRKNIEVIVATEVVDGTAGPPRVVATHFW